VVRFLVTAGRVKIHLPPIMGDWRAIPLIIGTTGHDGSLWAAAMLSSGFEVLAAGRRSANERVHYCPGDLRDV